MSKTVDETSSTPPRPAPTRRSTLDYFNPANASDRFWRLFSSREKVIENLKTLAWVVPITLVIWIYAEREQVVTPTAPNVSGVSVEIVSSDPHLWVEMVGTSKPTVNLKLTGPQKELEQVRALLTSVTVGLPRGLRIDIGSSLGTGNNQPVNIVDRIENMEPFKRNGVTVQAADPPTISVNIDTLGQRELPVQIPAGINNLTAETRFDPPKVIVSGPDSLLVKLIDSRRAYKDDLKANADLIGNEQLKAQGRHVLNAVQVTLSPPQDKLRIDPPLVKADVVVRAADVTYTIQNLPITVDAAPSTLHSFDLALTNSESTTFTVTGPKEQIDAIIDSIKPGGRAIVKAVLEITNDDGSITASPSKKLTYIMPPGVRVNQADLDRPVEFKLTRRDAGGT